MLYRLILPPKTQACLTDLLWIQLDLLDYAINSTLLVTPTPASSGTKADIVNQKRYRAALIEECATYLDRQSKHNTGYGQRIASKFFEASVLLDAREGRITLLRTFAQQSARIPHSKKRAWLTRLAREIEILFPESGVPVVNIQPFNTENQPWKKAAGTFFLYFYDAFLGDYKKIVPVDFITTAGEQSFSRQELIELFHEENPDLEICTMCDETKFYTRYRLQEDKEKKERNKVRSHVILDHYLPKNSYPHLCCHPYNLIPICYFCNSSVKSSYDPLKERGYKLAATALPYHDINLSKQAYMQVDVQHNGHTTLATIQGLASRNSADEAIIQEAVMLLRDVYNLPDRWSEERQMSSIMHTLFRRMRHFFDDSKSSLLVTDVEDEVFSKLKQLLYHLDHNDQQRDPYAFAMTWILTSFLNERNQQDSSAWKGLFQEITTSFEQSIDASRKREIHVEDLLNTYKGHK